MKLNSNHLDELPVKTLAALGIGAVVTLGALGAVYAGSIDIGPGPRVIAGSGSAPTNTVYKQPVVGDMNMGATATWTTPGPLPQVQAAVPAGR
jgi:hypothetical protein